MRDEGRVVTLYQSQRKDDTCCISVYILAILYSSHPNNSLFRYLTQSAQPPSHFLDCCMGNISSPSNPWSTPLLGNLSHRFQISETSPRLPDPLCLFSTLRPLLFPFGDHFNTPDKRKISRKHIWISYSIHQHNPIDDKPKTNGNLHATVFFPARYSGVMDLCRSPNERKFLVNVHLHPDPHGIENEWEDGRLSPTPPSFSRFSVLGSAGSILAPL